MKAFLHWLDVRQGIELHQDFNSVCRFECELVTVDESFGVT